MSLALRSILAPITLVLLLSLSDCLSISNLPGMSDPSEPDQSEATPEPTLTPFATPWPTPTPRLSPTPEPTPAATPEPEVTSDELEQFLIERDDLPTGWMVADVDAPIASVPGVEPGKSILVSSFFQQSDLGPYLAHMLLHTEDLIDARDAFDAIEVELDEAEVLDRITEQVRSWATEPVEFEEFGDETIAFKAIGDTGLVPVEADIVATREGQYITLIIHAQLMEVDTDLTEEFVQTAIERLPAARQFKPTPYMVR